LPAKLVLIFAFLLFTAPTATHALAKAARNSGLEPWMLNPEDSDALPGNKKS